MRKIAILASGGGTNAREIINYFKESKKIQVVNIGCNNPNAGVLNIAKQNNIPTFLLTKKNFMIETTYLEMLKSLDVEWVILAGFLWKVPSFFIFEFQDKIINIHPALLPKYGGKGMYGSYVHQAVIEAKEKETGITIHLVNEEYDKGKILFQAKFDIKEKDTQEDIEYQIHRLEHLHFPPVIEEVIFNAK